MEGFVSERKRKRHDADVVSTGSRAERIDDIDSPERVSTGGHMDPTGPGELPSDRHGAGTAERNRDRNAGLGEGLPHEGADIPDSETIGGQESSLQAAREILDAIEEREPREGRRARD
jgi:hypothetical protein